MNKIEELEKQAKTILEEIEKLKKEEKAESKVWKPENADEYYYIDNDAEIIGDAWYGSVQYDIARYKIGNCFKTREEAEKAVEKAKIYTQLKRLAEEINTEPIDWENNNQYKYRFTYNRNIRNLWQEYSLFNQVQGAIYSTNKDFLDIAKERIGEENLLKLFKE